jgi:hypothetical protein
VRTACVYHHWQWCVLPKAATAHAEVRWVSITRPCRQETLNHNGELGARETSGFQLRCRKAISEFGQRGSEKSCCSPGRQLSARRLRPCPSAGAVLSGFGFGKIRNDPPVTGWSSVENGPKHLLSIPYISRPFALNLLQTSFQRSSLAWRSLIPRQRRPSVARSALTSHVCRDRKTGTTSRRSLPSIDASAVQGARR